METLAVYGSLFASAFLAATILPLSSELVLIGLIASGRGEPAMLIAIATAGNTLGAVVNWLLGRGIDTLQDKRWFPVSREGYARASQAFRRFGGWSLLFSWFPIIGDAMTVAAGAARFPLLAFVVLVAVGKAARYGALVAGAEWLML